MDVQEQLCYIPCNFCSIVLAVSVPCSSLFDVVTVRCGHCTNLWNVNMAAALQCLPNNSNSNSNSNASSVAAVLQPQAPNLTSPEYKVELGSSSKWNNSRIPIHPSNANNKLPEPRIVNRPPEKRQRVPSAYNQFIKEEIQRIKANNPEISHREAFSSAAKNWAHFPHIHFGLMLETNNQAKLLNEGHDQKHKMRRTSAFLSK